MIDPDDLHYLMEYQVWVRLDAGGTATVGITRLGIALAGEIYMCRVKRIGTDIKQGDTLAVVELSKSIVAVKSPVSGRITAINPALEEHPEQVHRAPYGAGWLACLVLSDWARDLPQLVHGADVAPAMAHHARLHRQEWVPATGRLWAEPDRQPQEPVARQRPDRQT